MPLAEVGHVINGGYPGCGGLGGSGGGGITDGGLNVSGPTGAMGAAFGLLALFAVWVAWRRSTPAGRSPAPQVQTAQPTTVLTGICERQTNLVDAEWFVPFDLLDGPARESNAPQRDLELV